MAEVAWLQIQAAYAGLVAAQAHVEFLNAGMIGPAEPFELRLISGPTDASDAYPVFWFVVRRAPSPPTTVVVVESTLSARETGRPLLRVIEGISTPIFQDAATVERALHQFRARQVP